MIRRGSNAQALLGGARTDGVVWDREHGTIQKGGRAGKFWERAGWKRGLTYLGDVAQQPNRVSLAQGT